MLMADLRPSRSDQLVLAAYHRVSHFFSGFLHIVIFSESMPSEMLIGMLTFVLGLIVLDPSHNIITTTSAYAPLRMLPLPPMTIEVVWGTIFLVVGMASIVAVVEGSNRVRRYCTAISFTFWMFLMTMTMIAGTGLGWAYNLFFAVAQLITFIQLSYKIPRPRDHA